MSQPEPDRTIGVLLMAYGGPNSLEEIPAYLRDVREGREPSAELIAEMTHRYATIGGRSPILELTQAQARGIERELNASGGSERFRVLVGMRHWHPYIREVVPEMLAAGVNEIVPVVMAPHYSRMSVGRYLQRVREALAAQGAATPLRPLERWWDEPDFVAAIAERIEQGLARFVPESREDVYILFTAHSLPERILQWHDPYPEELRRSVEAVAEVAHPARYGFAFQSQGASAEPWLGPSVEETLERLAAEGVRNVLMVPIGFVCDHVEVLYDVDVEHRGQAEALGIRLERTASLNDAPLLCRAVASAVRARLAQPAEAEAGRGA
ncbi:MAG TPA: ferrochelatase [Thermomicrobiaceae bacterium]|nr:ferrochelatase [Thermomicrobiaceae bacterium]